MRSEMKRVEISLNYWLQLRSSLWFLVYYMEAWKKIAQPVHYCNDPLLDVYPSINVFKNKWKQNIMSCNNDDRTHGNHPPHWKSGEPLIPSWALSCRLHWIVEILLLYRINLKTYQFSLIFFSFLNRIMNIVKPAPYCNISFSIHASTR